MQHQDDGTPPTPAGRPEADDGSADGGDPVRTGPQGHGPPVSAESEEGRRPTPVRAAMEIGEEEERDRRGETRMVRDEESGAAWMVKVSGRSASGVLPLRTVPLMELSFAKVDEPGLPHRRALCFGADLLDIPDHELLSCLKSSEVDRERVRSTEGRDQSAGRRKERRGT